MLTIEILRPAIVVWHSAWAEPLSETPLKPNFWPSSAVHSLITNLHPIAFQLWIPFNSGPYGVLHTLITRIETLFINQTPSESQACQCYVPQDHLQDSIITLWILWLRLHYNPSLPSCYELVHCTTQLEIQKFSGASDIGFSSCAVPTYYHTSEYFNNQQLEVWKFRVMTRSSRQWEQ